MADTSNWLRVILVKAPNEPEAVPVTYIEQQDPEHAIGVLEMEPQQDFGVHKGDRLVYEAFNDENGAVVLVCDLNPVKVLKEEDLEDGSMLKKAIEVFLDGPDDEKFYELLLVCRDSKVWMAKDSEGLVDVFASGGELFVPVFSSREEMGEYGDEVPQVAREHMLPAMGLAKLRDREIKGVVINPFSRAFVLDRELCDVVAGLKSRIG